MSIPNTVLNIVIFTGFFGVIEYATYLIMERKHEKRDAYLLFFILAWTALALVHMWLVAPLLNLPPAAVIGFGLCILVIHIGGDLEIPVLSTASVVGLYPFALVYQFFVILLLVTEVVKLAASFISNPYFNIFLSTFPSDPQLQSALGLAVAASLVALLYYNPRGENGYYYAAGHHLPSPSVDYEKFRQLKESEASDEASIENEETSDPVGMTPTNPSREVSRASVMTNEGREFEYSWSRSDISFNDIGGYYDVKEQIAEEVLQPVQASIHGDDRYDRFGIEPSRGILFYGPPGTGKTLFARALAGELDIPFVELGPADITSKWINEGPQRVHQLFKEAESIGPCVIFFDEAEHLFGGRDVGAGGAHAEDRKITSELLVHLTAEDRNAIVVGATNRPEDIDPAILRPGRLSSHFEIDLPEEESRHAIFQSKLRGAPHELSGDELSWLARSTPSFSGAEIEELVTVAKRNAAKRDARKVSIEDFPSSDDLETMAKTTDPGELTRDHSEDRDFIDSASRKPFDDDPEVGFQ